MGLALGMAASRALTGALESLLFGVTPGDPVTFIGIGALLIVVAALAGYFPAWQSFANRSDGGIAVELTSENNVELILSVTELSAAVPKIIQIHFRPVGRKSGH